MTCDTPRTAAGRATPDGPPEDDDLDAAIVTIETEAREQALAEAEAAIGGLDLNALNPSINKREVLAALAALRKSLPPKEQE